MTGAEAILKELVVKRAIAWHHASRLGEGGPQLDYLRRAVEDLLEDQAAPEPESKHTVSLRTPS